MAASIVLFLILISLQRSSNGTNRYRFDVYKRTSDYPPNMSTFGFNQLGMFPRQKNYRSSDNTADARPTCIYTPTNCTIVHSTADSARDKMPSNWTESSQFCMRILRNARRHNVLKVSPKWFKDEVGEHHTCTGESQVSIFNTLKIQKRKFFINATLWNSVN